MTHFARIASFSTAAVLVAGSAHAKSGVPQMDPTWYGNQLFWLAISFVTLYVIVSQFVAPRVNGVLESRDAAINDAIAKAEELKAAATNTRGDFEAAGTEARAKAAAVIAEAQASTAKQAADAQAKLASELDAKAATAKALIAAALTKAQAGLDEAAISLTQAMSEKLLGAKVDAASVKTALQQAKKA